MGECKGSGWLEVLYDEQLHDRAFCGTYILLKHFWSTRYNGYLGHKLQNIFYLFLSYFIPVVPTAGLLVMVYVGGLLASRIYIIYL